MSGRPPALTVVGSINLDLVLRAPRLPRAGETVTGATFAQLPGGKGANQALAARRLGAEVALIGRVGDDAQAAVALTELRAAGVDLSRVCVESGVPTGIAAVTVADDGENRIVVAPGANARVDQSDVGNAASGGGVLCQLEISDDAVVAASRLLDCELFTLNAAPARPLPAAVWARADLVIVNALERDQLASELAGFAGLLAITLGATGATLAEQGQVLARAAPPTVEAIDTTGAGDAFSAALVVGLLEGRRRNEALARACAAGALATTCHGAQMGLPTAAEIDKLVP